ncbi:MAG: helix-turn-helix domain-containing protein, partial [Pseudomonas sp.]
MSEYLGINLKLACSHYRSISEVCRQLSINRAQFNKYLSGQSQPTAFNLKRIGDFFGVEDYELGLPPEQFARLIGARNPATVASQQGDP